MSKTIAVLTVYFLCFGSSGFAKSSEEELADTQRKFQAYSVLYDEFELLFRSRGETSLWQICTFRHLTPSGYSSWLSFGLSAVCWGRPSEQEKRQAENFIRAYQQVLFLDHFWASSVLRLNDTHIRTLRLHLQGRIRDLSKRQWLALAGEMLFGELPDKFHERYVRLYAGDIPSIMQFVYDHGNLREGWTVRQLKGLKKRFASRNRTERTHQILFSHEGTQYYYRHHFFFSGNDASLNPEQWVKGCSKVMAIDRPRGWKNLCLRGDVR